jgi:hypothetical protein
LDGNPELLESVKIHQSYVSNQVLATEVFTGQGGDHVTTVEVEGLSLTIGLRVATN